MHWRSQKAAAHLPHLPEVFAALGHRTHNDTQSRLPADQNTPLPLFSEQIYAPDWNDGAVSHCTFNAVDTYLSHYNYYQQFATKHALHWRE